MRFPESPLDSKEIKPVNPKRNQSWIFTGRTDAEAEALVLWPPDAKSNSLEKTLMLRKIEGRRKRGWQKTRWLDGITDSIDMSLSKLLSDGEGERSLACCSPWGRKESDTTEWLNWTHTKLGHTLLSVCFSLCLHPARMQTLQGWWSLLWLLVQP